MFRGYVKLYRSIKDNPIMFSPEHLTVWIYLLISANHKNTSIVINNQKILIPCGSLLTSRARIGKDTHIHESKVERILKYLKIEQQIEQQSFNKYRIISITNWSVYQDSEQQSEQQMNSKRTADEQQMNTYKNDKNDKHNKNDKKKGFIPPTLNEVQVYCNERKNTINPEKFIDYYLSNGWMIGKNKMKDWKAAIRTWEKNNQNGGLNYGKESRIFRGNSEKNSSEDTAGGKYTGLGTTIEV